ncbi:MAG: type IV pilus modification protein PilV [Gammaproteobacteria bacterium]
MATSTPLYRSHQQALTTGFSLLEVLIALVILSVGLLGIAGLMATTLKSNDSAYMRTQATTLAYNMLDRMRTNLAATNTLTYNVTMPASATTSNSEACTTGSCSYTDLAAYDMGQWEYDLGQTLPQGRGSITSVAAGGPVSVTITVLWNDSRAQASLQKTGAPVATTFSLSVTSMLQ